jgi:hypothetical protein
MSAGSLPAFNVISLSLEVDVAHSGKTREQARARGQNSVGKPGNFLQDAAVTASRGRAPIGPWMANDKLPEGDPWPRFRASAH